MAVSERVSGGVLAEQREKGSGAVVWSTAPAKTRTHLRVALDEEVRLRNVRSDAGEAGAVVGTGDGTKRGVRAAEGRWAQGNGRKGLRAHCTAAARATDRGRTP